MEGGKVNYIALSIPVFFVLIAIELAYSLYRKRKLYRLNDSLTNLSLGVGQQVVGVFMKGALFAGYLFIYEHWRVASLPSTWWTWLLLFFGVDFFYYWFHRMSHEVNALWAGHIVHHQSEEYNLSVALRQSWFQSAFAWVFYLPLAFAGFEPIMFLTVSSFNTLYQFWIHTRTIGRMGPLEWVLNTPSHHRVHHGSNPKYIDKNHAGSLIIWDRMFGTFKEEEEEPVYGITTQLKSWNPIWANLHYWQELFNIAAHCRRIQDKIRVFIAPPGWQPAELGGMQRPKDIDLRTYHPYDLDRMRQHHAYILLVFIIGLGAGIWLLAYEAGLTFWPKLFVGILSLWAVLNVGGMLEARPWIIGSEYGRILLPLMIYMLFRPEGMATLHILALGVASVMQFVWFARVVRMMRKDALI